MNARSQRIRRALWLSAAAATAAVMIVPAVTSSVAAQPASLAGTSSRGPGYPPPGGIYKLFTNCPLKNPLMHEANVFTACTAGVATSGSIKLGNLTTQVTEPVNVQFGFWTPPNQTYFADVVPPLAGTAAQLVTKPDLVPESLTTALGCPSTNATIENMCQQAAKRGGAYNQVFALAQSAGNITNFALVSWTQPVKFQLINPLLGNNCYVGTDGDPVVLNPSLSITSAKVKNDPDPAAHPDTFVLATKASASDTTFSAPGVTGCGPGGAANIAVDQALDTSAGLPAASGTNSLTLTGTFDVGACQASTDSSVPQPADDAAILLAAFKASTSAGGDLSGHQITVAGMKRLLGLHH
jgi:hypothetical protein